MGIVAASVSHDSRGADIIVPGDNCCEDGIISSAAVGRYAALALQGHFAAITVHDPRLMHLALTRRIRAQRA